MGSPTFIGYNTSFFNGYIKEVKSDNNAIDDFRKVSIDWNNPEYENNEPITIGSAFSSGNAYSFSSNLINDPITAKNIALNILRQSAMVEKLKCELSFAPFLDGGDCASIDIDEDYLQYDKDTEYLVLDIEHDFKNNTTIVSLMERLVIEERKSI
jgi:hypothetical protein